MSYTISEILKNIVGYSNGKPKSAVSFNVSHIDTVNNTVIDETGINLCNAEVKIKKVNEYITVDLSFVNKFSSELNRLWSILELYGEKMSTPENFEEESIVKGVFTFLPISLKGRAFISAINPIYWTLMPYSPSGENSVIRLLFKDSTFLFLEGEEIDTNALRESIEQEIQKEEAYMQQIADKMEEDEDYKNERNERINDLRKIKTFTEPQLYKKEIKDNDNEDDENNDKTNEQN